MSTPAAWIADLLNAARVRNGLTSDRQLGAVLTPPRAERTVKYWRSSGALPPADAIIELATLASRNRLDTLIEYSILRDTNQPLALAVWLEFQNDRAIERAELDSLDNAETSCTDPFAA